MAKLHLPCILTLLSLAGACTATVYTVGDSAGWDVSADLTSWPLDKKFVVGDILSFQYSRYHSVNEVTADDYDNCTTAANSLKSSKGGNTTIALTSPGRRYFICGVKIHCLGGMKLRVNVLDPAAMGPAGSPQGGSTGSGDGDAPGDSGGAFHGGRKACLLVSWSCVFLVYMWLGSLGL